MKHGFSEVGGETVVWDMVAVPKGAEHEQLI